MAETLLRADRSSALAAASSPVTIAGPFEIEEATALTEAVFRVLADGQVRTFAQIATALGGTPEATIANEIERLRRCGMPIESERGAVFVEPFVPLDAAALDAALVGAGRAAWSTEVVFATRSTNSEVLSAVRAQVPAAPVLLAAEVQFAGRGRLGRRWSSAPGTSLTASFALVIGRRLSELDGGTLVCGLAVHAVLGELGVEARLKWPNDVLVGPDKVAGILVEAHAAGGSSVLVIGIGVNVAGMPNDSERGALRRTTLEEVGIRDVDRNVLAARLARALEAEMSAFEANGFGPFAGRWNAVDAFADRSVTLDADHGARRIGIARGVDERGALSVDVEGRRQRIVAGDVSLRTADGAVA